MPHPNGKGFAMPTHSVNKTILLIGASRDLGYAMADEYSRLEWRLVATLRATARTQLHDLADKSGNSVEIEHLDICEADPARACGLPIRFGFPSEFRTSESP